MEILVFAHIIAQGEWLIGGLAPLSAGIQTQAEGSSATFNPQLPRSLWGPHPNQCRREKSMEERERMGEVSWVSIHGLKLLDEAPLPGMETGKCNRSLCPGRGGDSFWGTARWHLCTMGYWARVGSDAFYLQGAARMMSKTWCWVKKGR